MQIAVQKHGWIAIGLAVLAVATQLGQTRVFAQTFAHKATTSCSGGGGGITLPKGFWATIFADNIGHARQLVVAPDGTVSSTPGAVFTTATISHTPVDFSLR